MRPRREISLGFTQEHVHEGMHICYIYDDEDERKQIIKKYLETGLLSDEKVLCLVENISPEEIRNSLHGLEFKPDALTVMDSLQGYCPTGSFDGNKTLNLIRDFYRQAVDIDGYAGARGTGQMSWSLNRNLTTEQDLIEYEARVNQISREYAYTSICQYEARKFSGRMIMDVLTIHPMMIIRGQIVKNPFYIEPEQFLEKYRARG